MKHTMNDHEPRRYKRPATAKHSCGLSYGNEKFQFEMPLSPAVVVNVGHDGTRVEVSSTKWSHDWIGHKKAQFALGNF